MSFISLYYEGQRRFKYTKLLVALILSVGLISITYDLDRMAMKIKKKKKKNLFKLIAAVNQESVII